MGKRVAAIVTGANAGAGFGTCHRLLLQLSRSSPSDTLRQAAITHSDPSSDSSSTYVPCEQLTLVLACRNQGRAEAARERLFRLLDADLREQRKQKGYDGHGDIFRSRLEIVFIRLDLASVDSVFDFCDEITKRYSYVTHLFLNAGGGCFTKLRYLAGAWAIMKDPVLATTYPDYKEQAVGILSHDGLGMTWQCNFFGHYILVRALTPHLNLAPDEGSRVLWTTSIQSSSRFFSDTDDWQLLKTNLSYEASKYCIELVAQGRNVISKDGPKVRHFLIHPGIVATDMFYAFNGWLFHIIMIMAFYLARICGSDNHPIHVYEGAISAIHVALTPLAFLSPIEQPIRYGSKSTLGGKAYVGEDRIEAWETREADSRKLISRFENLYSSLAKLRKQNGRVRA